MKLTSHTPSHRYNGYNLNGYYLEEDVRRKVRTPTKLAHGSYLEETSTAGGIYKRWAGAGPLHRGPKPPLFSWALTTDGRSWVASDGI
jgi:hypothetical protein